MADEHPPPPFPRWLVRLDPLLERAGENELYMAFLARRRRGTSVNGWLLAVRMRLFTAICTTLIITSIVMSLSGRWGQRWAFVPSFVAFAVIIWHSRQSLQPKPIKGGTMPPKVSDVFSATAFAEQAATDIWLAGVSGREVLEAVYLEHRESSAVVGVLAAAALLIGASLWAASWVENGWGLPLMALGVTILAYGGFQLSVFLHREVFATEAVISRYGAWDAAGYGGLRSAYGSGGYIDDVYSHQLSKPIAVPVMLMLPAGTIVLAAGWAPEGTPRELVVAVGLCLLGLMMQSLPAFLSKLHPNVSRKLIAGGAEPFERYMRCVVARDPDAGAPARPAGKDG